MRGYDPIERAEKIRELVTRREDSIEKRKYYRFRPSRFYGGSAVADSVGCNLMCGFCWSWRANTYIDRYGELYSPREVASRLLSIAIRYRYRYIRVSGGEPTLAWRHLVDLLKELESMGITRKGIAFILETNGILIGWNREFARDLSQFSFVHVRVSLKGCTPEEFSMLTGADPIGFEYQLRSLKNLLDYGVSVHPAVMMSFSTRESLEYLAERLREIDDRLPYELEDELVILYPHVIEILRKRGLKPRVAVDPRTWSLVEEVKL